jgi:hypothetical protein
VPALAGSVNTELKSIQTGPGFECRNQNGAAAGKLSAHAEGLAIDIAGFELANGRCLIKQVKANLAVSLACLEH